MQFRKFLFDFLNEQIKYHLKSASLTRDTWSRNLFTRHVSSCVQMQAIIGELIQLLFISICRLIKSRPNVKDRNALVLANLLYSLGISLGDFKIAV